MDNSSNQANNNTYTKWINYDIVYSVFAEIISDLLSSQEKTNEKD